MDLHRRLARPGRHGHSLTVTSAVNPIAIDVTAIHGKFNGSLTANTLDGTWHQNADRPLTLTRQTSALASTGPPLPPPDPAIPAVTADNLKSVLDRDLAAALDHGALAPSTHAGITIGILQHGVSHVFTYGTAKPDSVFEIGSLTKTFTALILAQMVQQQKVRLDEPVRDLLPPNTVAKPTAPKSPSSISAISTPAFRACPTTSDPPTRRIPTPITTPTAFTPSSPSTASPFRPTLPSLYSNLGVGLLGQALADRAGVPYAELLHQQVTGPLHMTDTVIAIPPALQSRFIQGYTAEHKPAHAWDLDALAGAGAIRSTAADMLIYLDAQLRPDRLSTSTLAAPNGKTLPAAIEQTHVLHADVGHNQHIALNWFRHDDTGTYWHNGGTAAFSSYAAFNPQQDFAIIVLNNTGPGGDDLTDTLGAHIEQRLEANQPSPSHPTNKQVSWRVAN